MNYFLSKKIPILYFIILTSLITVCFHIIDWNARKIHPSPVFPINHNVTYGNVDNTYYLSQVDNYMDGKGWRNDPAVGNGSYFRRTPGYSLVYLFARLITPNIPAALVVCVIIHFILYLLAFVAFSKTLLLFNVKNIIYNMSMLFLSVIPYFYHTILSTMTESISVYLVIIATYFLLKAYNEVDKNKKIKFYIYASFFLGYTTLTRPYLGLLLLLLPTFGFIEYYKNGIFSLVKNYVIIGLIPIFLIGGWTLRNYIVTKEFVPLEVAYHPQSLDRMKPEFRGFWNFVKCWGEDGAKFNNYQIPMFQAALAGDTSYQYIQNTLDQIPKDVITFCGIDQIKNVLLRYQHLVWSQKKYYDNQIPMPAVYNSEQLIVENMFNDLSEKYNKEHRIIQLVFSPLKYLQQIIFHSNTVGIYFMQQPFRHFTILNILRYISLIIHISLFFFIFISMYTMRNKMPYFILFVLVPIIYLLFFSYYVQSIEQRYYSPILPLLIIGAIYNINIFYEKFSYKNSLPRP